jgi:phosphatidylglycerophosphatase A
MHFLKSKRRKVNINRFLSFIYELIATFFYVGYIPFAPGTCASIVSLIVLFFLPPLPLFLFLNIFLILFLVGVFVAKKLAICCKQTDPSIVVIDEVAGMMLSLFMVPKVWWLYAIALCFFRIFDIFKPCFVKKVERIHGGWGIMLDDFWAGILTLGVVHSIRLFTGF